MGSDEIKQLAQQARGVFENHRDAFGILAKGFPRGACGTASDFFGYWLKKNGALSVEYVWGQRDGVTHGWLEIGDLIIDITSDQFEDGVGAVFVETERKFHDTFVNQMRGPASLSTCNAVELGLFCEYMNRST
ncbi:hypothetical protein GCM10028811_15920 [Uliginosibacterium sediminicola]